MQPIWGFLCVVWILNPAWVSDFCSYFLFISYIGILEIRFACSNQLICQANSTYLIKSWFLFTKSTSQIITSRTWLCFGCVRLCIDIKISTCNTGFRVMKWIYITIYLVPLETLLSIPIYGINRLVHTVLRYFKICCLHAFMFHNMLVYWEADSSHCMVCC